MKGILGSEPDGITGDCFWVLIMYPPAQTTARLQELVNFENTSLGYPARTMAQVSSALRELTRMGLVEQAGLSGRGHKAAWMISDYGHKMCDVWSPDSDPEPVREACGFGWPIDRNGGDG